MASQAILQQHRAIVVPFPVTQEAIPQSALEQLVELRQKANAIEADIRRRLEIGASVEPGQLRARVQVVVGTLLVVE